MKRVLTFGVFDYFHLGHLALLEQAKGQGDMLIVAVQEDDAVQKYKPQEELFYTTQDRMRLVRALRVVDCVVPYQDVDRDIAAVDFDVLALGEDQNHDGFKRAVQWCQDHGKEVVRLHYTAGISSSKLKKNIEKRL